MKPCSWSPGSATSTHSTACSSASGSAGEHLHHRGSVEWGFRAPDVLEVLREARYAAQSISPFVDPPRMRGTVWLAPRLRAEVSYADMATGQLRAPSWRGLVRR